MGIGTWESHAAITRLLHRYHQCFNQGRWDELGALFERATYQTIYPWDAAGHGVQSGAEEVADNFRRMVKLHDGLPRMQYSLSNLVLDVDEDAGTATGASQYVGLSGGPATWGPRSPGLAPRGEDARIEIVCAGRYEDTFARTAGPGGEWHFTSRRIHADFTGDRSSHLQVDPTGA